MRNGSDIRATDHRLKGGASYSFIAPGLLCFRLARDENRQQRGSREFYHGLLARRHWREKIGRPYRP